MAVVTSNLVVEYVGKLAKNGTAPGNNTDPTGTWDAIVGGSGYDGTLSNYGYTTATGWAGDGTSGDPYRLENNGTTTTSAVVGCGNTGFASGWSAITLEAWVRVPATLSGTFPRIIDKSGTSSTGFAVYLQSSSGTIIVKFKSSGSTLYDSGPSATDLRNSTRHLVVTYDDADDYLRAYVDASAAVPVLRTGGGTVEVGTEALVIGNRSGTNDRPMDGGIATVRIYSVALSASQVAENFNSGITASSIDGAAATLDRSFLLARGIGIG
jgi:hypothetical protein